MGFERVTSFFQASSFQLLILENLLRWSFFTFFKTSLLITCKTSSYATAPSHPLEGRGDWKVLVKMPREWNSSYVQRFVGATDSLNKFKFCEFEKHNLNLSFTSYNLGWFSMKSKSVALYWVYIDRIYFYSIDRGKATMPSWTVWFVPKLYR